jgi:multidrug transporter EmrE-like cation transporter
MLEYMIIAIGIMRQMIGKFTMKIINPFKNFFEKRTLKQFVLYHFRWQLGFVVIYPVTHFSVSHNLPLFAALGLSNIVGACIFFFVDKVIFGLNINRRNKK